MSDNAMLIKGSINIVNQSIIGEFLGSLAYASNSGVINKIFSSVKVQEP